MKYCCILYLTIELFWVACSQNGTEYRRLAEADTLLYHSFVETADSLLIEINPQNEEDSAYYFLLRAQTDFRLHDVPNINQLNYSIAYYEKHPDSRKLADSYYYKVCYFTSFDSLPNEVFVMIKKAEKLAENTFDDNLKNKICTALCCVNNIMGETEEALKYANREYYYAQRLNSRRDMAYALIKLAVLHKNSNHADSCDYYTKQCIFLADEVDEQDKSFIYNLLGDCFFEIDPIAAEVYYNKALSYKKIPESFKSLADIYFEKNDTLRWRQYCDSALSYAWNELKVTISLLDEYTSQLGFMKKQNDELSERCNDADKIIATNNQAIDKLRQVCDNLIAQTDSVLADGKIVYNLIVDGKSITDYKEKYAACFYYFEKNYPEKLNIFDTYHDLTIENRLFLIADYLHQDDSIISKIFSITKSTVRSRRTKMKIKID